MKTLSWVCWELTKYRVSVGIGGTFMALVALDEKNGEILNAKESSTPREPAKAVIKRALRKTMA